MKTENEKGMIYLCIPRAHDYMEILRFPQTPYGRSAMRECCDTLSNDNRPFYIADSVIDLVEPKKKPKRVMSVAKAASDE